ncbi:MAG TPA: hypothetical protein VNA89_02580 [Gemmatimonadaceae bacterium]|nr:hypothetical protein [Gemmatimonadaceae bacterium]
MRLPGRHTRARVGRASLRWAGIAAVAAACARVPAEAVELSHVASRRVADTQTAHEALVQSYFRLSRARVEDFLEHRWTPTFLRNFVEQGRLLQELDNPAVLTDDQRRRLSQELGRVARLQGDPLEQALRAVNSAFADAERGKIALEFAEAATQQIARQRQELMGPIDTQERDVLNALRANYAEMMEIQTAITAFLQSVQDVKATEDAVLKRLNLLRARDTLVTSAIRLNDAVVDLTEKAGDAEAVLTEIRSTLGLRAPRDTAPAVPPPDRRRP